MVYYNIAVPRCLLYQLTPVWHNGSTAVLHTGCTAFLAVLHSCCATLMMYSAIAVLRWRCTPLCVVLWYVIVCCVCWVIMHCAVMCSCHSALRGAVLYRSILCYSTLRWVVQHCTVVLRCTCSTLPERTVLYPVIAHCGVSCDRVLCYSDMCYTLYYCLVSWGAVSYPVIPC